MADSQFQPDGQYIDTWYLRRGSNFQQWYGWKTRNELDPEVLDPVDLSAWTARGGIYDRADKETVLIPIGTADGTVTLSAAGDIDIHISHEVTAAIPDSKKGVFDLELVSPDGLFVRNFVGGTAEFLTELTK